MKLLLSVGEKSAEKYASLLVLELKKRQQNIEFYSFGSDLLAQDTQKIADYREISIIGFKEALNIVPKAVKLLRQIEKVIVENNIDALVLMDFPDFNLRLAKFAKKMGKKVIYYITPQVWAWRQSRLRQLNLYSDLIIPILPFEKTYFNMMFMKHGFNQQKIKYCGHPIIDILHNHLSNNSVKENIILILPGSRASELRFHTKIFFEAAKLLKEDFPNYNFIVPTLDYFVDYYNEFLEDYPFIEISTDIYGLMKKSKFAITKSGTITLELALFGLPMVVAYKLSNLSYAVGKALIHGVSSISLPNIIYGNKFIPELIQYKVTPKNIYEKSKSILTNHFVENQMKQELLKVKYSLGKYPVTPKIAEEITNFL